MNATRISVGMVAIAVTCLQVMTLVALESKPNASMQNSTLITAMQRGKWPKIEALITAGASAQVTDKDGKSLFSYCVPLIGVGLFNEPCYADFGDRKPEEWAQWLFDQGAHLTQADVIGKDGAPLHMHCGFGTWLHRLAYALPIAELMQQCVALGVPVEAHDDNKCTPLYAAVARLRQGFAWTDEEEQEHTARVLKGIDILVTQLKADPNGICWDQTPLFRSITTGDHDGRIILPLVEQLLKLKADPNIPVVHKSLCKCTEYPLAYVLKSVSNEEHAYRIAELLLTHGARVNAHHGIVGNAIDNSSERIFELLIKHGMDLTQKVGIESALACMITEIFAKKMRLYNALQNGLPPQADALYKAAARGYDDLAGLLLAKGASPKECISLQCYQALELPEHLRTGSVVELVKNTMRARKASSFYRETQKNKKCAFMSALLHRVQTDPEMVHDTFSILWERYQQEPTYALSSTSKACYCHKPELSDYKVREELKKYGTVAECEAYSEAQIAQMAHDAFKDLVAKAYEDAYASCKLRKLLSIAKKRVGPFYAAVINQDLAWMFDNHDGSESSRRGVCDGIYRLIKRGCEKFRTDDERALYQRLFAACMAKKPSDWKPTWAHMQLALESLHGKPYLAHLVRCGTINAYGPNGKTVLLELISAETPAIEMIQAALEAGADANLADASHAFDTPLHYAIHKGGSNPDEQCKALKALLLTHGADMQQENAYGLTPAQLEELYVQATQDSNKDETAEHTSETDPWEIDHLSLDNDEFY